MAAFRSILGKSVIYELWLMIGSEGWCVWCVMRGQSKERHQFIGIDHWCHEFEMGFNSLATRSFTSLGVMARSSAAAHGGVTYHLHGYDDVVNRPLAWRDRGSRQPPK
jgi:hypothetical protein